MKCPTSDNHIGLVKTDNTEEIEGYGTYREYRCPTCGNHTLVRESKGDK